MNRQQQRFGLAQLAAAGQGGDFANCVDIGVDVEHLKRGQILIQSESLDEQLIESAQNLSASMADSQKHDRTIIRPHSVQIDDRQLRRLRRA